MKSNVKRYHPEPSEPGVYHHNIGDYVLFSDYEKLEAKLQKAKLALQFYANPSVWGNGGAEIDYCDVYIDDISIGIPRGGLKAIETLKEIEE
jgi:hypothetical protein